MASRERKKDSRANTYEEDVRRAKVGNDFFKNLMPRFGRRTTVTMMVLKKIFEMKCGECNNQSVKSTFTALGYIQ
jgi:hypothetical protein